MIWNGDNLCDIVCLLRTNLLFTEIVPTNFNLIIQSKQNTVILELSDELFVDADGRLNVIKGGYNSIE